MKTTTEAVFVNGVFKPVAPLSFRENHKYRLVVEPLEPDEALVQRFEALVDKWRSETEHLSSLSTMSQHAAYQEIIGMGQAAVPLLLHALRQKPQHFGPALAAITGARPVLAEHAGNLALIAEDWLAWGRAQGYLV